jgi:hypothetical protein
MTQSTVPTLSLPISNFSSYSASCDAAMHVCSCFLNLVPSRLAPAVSHLSRTSLPVCLGDGQAVASDDRPLPGCSSHCFGRVVRDELQPEEAVTDHTILHCFRGQIRLRDGISIEEHWPQSHVRQPIAVRTCCCTGSISAPAPDASDRVRDHTRMTLRTGIQVFARPRFCQKLLRSHGCLR